MTYELMDKYRVNYTNDFGTVNFKWLKRDYKKFIDYDDTLVYEDFYNGLDKVYKILENRMFNHSATSQDIKVLSFITRNYKELVIALEFK